MLVTRKPRDAIRTLQGWAIGVLREVDAIRECEEHGWMKDRADPHARDRAIAIARQYPPAGYSATQAVDAIKDTFDAIGDTCPECRD